MKAILVTILIVHLLLGYWFVSRIARSDGVITGWFSRSVITVFVSVISIGITVVAFVYMPELNSLPWGFMEGGLVLTYPLFFAVFTMVYFAVAKGLLAASVKIGYATTSDNAYS